MGQYHWKSLAKTGEERRGSSEKIQKSGDGHLRREGGGSNLLHTMCKQKK